MEPSISSFFYVQPGAADLDEIADFRWQLASQRAIHQVELLELVAELVDVVRERKARIVGGKNHFVPPRFHAKDLDRQSARKPVPVELELLEARELSKLGRQLACEGQSARVLVSADRSFLTQGNVFTDDQIDAYIDLKMEEVIALEHAPHPIEFQMYYSV